MPFSCFLFRPRKSREKRRKRSHTNVSNASVIRFSTPSAQAAHVRFRTRKRVHTRLCSKDCTQRLARRNRGCFGWGRYYYPRSVPHVSETLRGRVSERQTLAILGLGRRRSRRTQNACGTAMRLCASLFRGVAAPLGGVILLLLSKLRLVRPALGAFYAHERCVVSLPSVRFTCCRNAGRPLVKRAHLPFSEVAEQHSLRGHFFC